MTIKKEAVFWDPTDKNFLDECFLENQKEKKINQKLMKRYDT
jgi:hypothetical protein